MYTYNAVSMYVHPCTWPSSCDFRKRHSTTLTISTYRKHSRVRGYILVCFCLNRKHIDEAIQHLHPVHLAHVLVRERESVCVCVCIGMPCAHHKVYFACACVYT